MPPVQLSAENLGMSFPGRGRSHPPRTILRSVSFSVSQGETLGIMGDSGTGKTTLAKILAGLESATHGKVMYSGTDIRHLRAQEKKTFRSRVQMVFQNPEASLNPKKIIQRSLSEVLGLKNVPRPERPERIAQGLHEVGLSTEILNRFPRQLSGGQNQRVALARTLLLEPEFLILDEPTSALDISARAHLLQLLRSLQVKQDLGFIFISHEPDVIQFMAHRVGLITDHTLRIV